MNRTARKVLVALSAFVSLGLLLRLLAASPAARGPNRGPEPESSETSPGFPSLPWEPFRHPGDELVQVSTILEAPSSTTNDKLDQLSLFASEAQPPLVRGLAQFATGLVLLARFRVHRVERTGRRSGNGSTRRGFLGYRWSLEVLDVQHHGPRLFPRSRCRYHRRSRRRYDRFFETGHPI